MNREQFLARLRDALGNMPDAQKQDILYDYEEHFSVGGSEGKDEEEIARSLGDPSVIGNSYRVEAMLDKSTEGGGVTVASVLRAVFASVSLTFLNVVFVLGPFFALVGVLFGMWAIAASLMVAGMGLVVSPILPGSTRLIADPLLNGVFALFSGIGIAAIGLLASIGMLFLTKWFFIGVAAYVKFNARIIRGEK